MFVEEAEQWQPRPVDVSITVCANVREESQGCLRRKEDGDGCLTTREVVSECPPTCLTCPPGDTTKPQLMLLGSEDHLSSPSDSGNR